MFIIGLIIGLFIGTVIGITLMCLISSSRGETDEER